MTSGFTPVAKLSELPEESMKQVAIGEQLVGLYRCQDAVYAMGDICSHEYAHLSDGDFDCEEFEVECPLHGARFDVRTGDVLSLPATKPVNTYQVKIEGDLVLVGPENTRS